MSIEQPNTCYGGSIKLTELILIYILISPRPPIPPIFAWSLLLLRKPSYKMLSRIRAFCSTSMTSLPIWWYLNPTNLRCALPFLFVRSDLLAPLSSGYPLLAAQQPMTYYPFWAGVRRRSWLGVGVRSYDYIYIWRLFMAYIWVFEAVYFFFSFFWFVIPSFLLVATWPRLYRVQAPLATSSSPYM